MAISFAPNGLQAVKNITAASWSGQTQTFPIGKYNNGQWGSYNQNIYNGDPVCLSSGSLASTAWTVSGLPDKTVNPIGVFTGCSYQSTPNSNSGFNTTSSGNPMYVYGTVSYDGYPVTGQIISDPNVIYTVLVAGGDFTTPIPLSDEQKTLLINGAGGTGILSFRTKSPVNTVGAGSILGNNVTGQSFAFMSINSFVEQGGRAALLNSGNSFCYVNILGVSADPQLNVSLQDPYLFIEVQLANHFYNRSVVAGGYTVAETVKTEHFIKKQEEPSAAAKPDKGAK